MRDHRGLTALNCSAIKGDLKLSKLLIEKVSELFFKPFFHNNMTVRLALMWSRLHQKVALLRYTQQEVVMKNCFNIFSWFARRLQ
jgi:ankyrin repeat protein